MIFFFLFFRIKKCQICVRQATKTIGDAKTLNKIKTLSVYRG